MDFIPVDITQEAVSTVEVSMAAEAFQVEDFMAEVFPAEASAEADTADSAAVMAGSGTMTMMIFW